MRPQDIDAHGRVALHDTATDEVTHVSAHLAQETLARNKETGRFVVLTKDGKDSALAEKRDANQAKRRKVLMTEEKQRKLEEHGGAFADMTDVDFAAHEAPPTQPAADVAPGTAEQEADPEKEAKVIREEAKAQGITLHHAIKDPQKLRDALAAEQKKRAGATE